MKLEEVLPHLRAGGRVKAAGYDTREMTLEELTDRIHISYLFTKDYEIVKEPLKIVTTGHHLSDRFAVKMTNEELDNLDKTKLYKVTIEEIENE